MHSQLSRALGLAAAALLVAGAAQAQGKGRDKGNDKGKDHGKERAEGAEQGIKEHAVVNAPQSGQVVRDREGRIVAVRVPPGLAKKPGRMPPGQYKKLYNVNQGADVLGGIFRNNGYTVTRVVPSGSSRYVYYRTRDGREQRAIVRPGTSQLSFSNVPPSLLQQVLARLY